MIFGALGLIRRAGVREVVLHPLPRLKSPDSLGSVAIEPLKASTAGATFLEMPWTDGTVESGRLLGWTHVTYMLLICEFHCCLFGAALGLLEALTGGAL